MVKQLSLLLDVQKVEGLILGSEACYTVFLSPAKKILG
jgi:hypothetical protein